jgi:hypothetical protein
MEYRAGEVPVHYAVPALGLVDEAALERIGDRWQLISGPEKDRGTPPRPVYANITPRERGSSVSVRRGYRAEFAMTTTTTKDGTVDPALAASIVVVGRRPAAGPRRCGCPRVCRLW